MKNTHIIWKKDLSAKDYLSVKEYEYHKQQSDKKAELWRYKMEK